MPKYYHSFLEQCSTELPDFPQLQNAPTAQVPNTSFSTWCSGMLMLFLVVGKHRNQHFSVSCYFWGVIRLISANKVNLTPSSKRLPVPSHSVRYRGKHHPVLSTVGFKHTVTLVLPYILPVPSHRYHVQTSSMRSLLQLSKLQLVSLIKYFIDSCLSDKKGWMLSLNTMRSACAVSWLETAVVLPWHWATVSTTLVLLTTSRDGSPLLLQAQAIGAWNC